MEKGKYVTMIKVTFDDDRSFHNFYDFMNSELICLKGCNVQPMDNDSDEDPLEDGIFFVRREYKKYAKTAKVAGKKFDTILRELEKRIVKK